jgi:hypothetical protein
MKPFSLLLSSLVLVVVGCSAASPDDEPSANASALSTWTKVSSCEGGAMVVDVAGYPMTPAAGHDPDYAVQAVIRNEDILKYLESRGAITRNPANPAEAIIPGHTWLSTFHDTTFTGSFSSDLPNGVTATFTRYGSGIKLTFDRQAGSACPSFCTNPTDPEYDPSSGVCEGCVHGQGPDTEEVANWWFGSCPVLADIHR